MTKIACIFSWRHRQSKTQKSSREHWCGVNCDIPYNVIIFCKNHILQKNDFCILFPASMYSILVVSCRKTILSTKYFSTVYYLSLFTPDRWDIYLFRLKSSGMSWILRDIMPILRDCCWNQFNPLVPHVSNMINRLLGCSFNGYSNSI